MPIPYDALARALFNPESAPTVFGTAPVPSLTALAVEAARLAYVRAERGGADLARLGADLAQAGFGLPTAFHSPRQGAQGYAALRADGLALVAFRGTQASELKDALSDLSFLPQPWVLGQGKVHTGFAQSALALAPQVRAWLDGPARQRQRLLVCGHSLGAAIATLLALPLGADSLITIGSPRVGDERFADSIDAAGLEVLRIVDHLDVVPRVPPKLLVGYRHAGRAVFIDAQGQVVEQPSADQVDAEVGLDPWRLMADHRSRDLALPRELTDHAPVNYLRAFWP
jgi:pimeloyl-ACP methyl ester carboxylesterase